MKTAPSGSMKTPAELAALLEETAQRVLENAAQTATVLRAAGRWISALGSALEECQDRRGETNGR